MPSEPDSPIVQRVETDQDVVVMHEGLWCDGILREWRRHEDGTWTGWVRFRVRHGDNRLGVFPSEYIRQVPESPHTPKT